MLQKSLIHAALVCLVSFCAAPAGAHFIWLDLVPTASRHGQVRLYFSEEPAPGETHLIGKVAHSQAWLRDAAGDVHPLKLQQADGDAAALVAACPDSQPVSLEGSCDYGIFDRGAGPMLLQYYAKHLLGDWAKQARFARAKRLKLDIVPTLSARKLAVRVLYDGKPVANNPVMAVDPAGDEHELETNAEGRAQINASPGRWAIRAGHTLSTEPGQRDGKPYDKTMHYCTLVLEVPGLAAEPSTLSAGEVLKRARDARALWQNFPGFAADVTIRADGQEVTGKLSIDSDGGVTLDMPDSPIRDWAEEHFYSLVQHRMPDGEISTGKVTYADDQVDHPLGRKINLGDPDLDSVYRIKDDVITEVNRSMGPSRFTISVLEVDRNAEGKYLPRSFVMSFYDSASGALEMSLAHRNQWQRIGNFDLPKRTLEINAHQGGSSTKEIIYRNPRLLGGK